MFRGCTFKDQPVDGANDGGFYQEIFSKDGILWGCEMTTTNDSFTMQPGELIISGRVIWVDGATQIPFTGPIQNGYGQVLLTIDLSKTATKEEFDQIEVSVVYSTTSLFPELTQGEINTSNGDMVYQQELAVVSIAGGNITGITRQIGGAEIDAEKLGGQLPEYYAKAADLLPPTAKQINSYPTDISGQGATYAWDDGKNVHITFFVLFTPGGDGIPSGGKVANFQGIVPLPGRNISMACLVGKANNTWLAGFAEASTGGEIGVVSGDQSMFSRALGYIVYPKKF